MDLKTPLVFVWFVGISGMHGIFYGIAVCCSNRKRRAMDRAHGIDPSKMLDSSSSAGSVQDGGGGGGGGDNGSWESGGSSSSPWSRQHEQGNRWGSEVNSSSYLMLPSS